ncbi:AGL042Wp [Eremothecium gossypii ATCC 10895]|uniref:UDP-N-acetylglucosamine transferase subunit ALG13 n=1 Tax=Eremothecium gossypii (strain ATCC 10895 / CBS 109.51 / FGSC 9923 / NRRL Y-1056) TaxID=284811 RepID=ALG13_EREGS|nr:AGL042Wp [Eremothecium gossypii ATCC 10895]Q750J3.1 RecName: Full=UDP-N-acetylglucosamine transferase subunit ALG13; AltName: Full=Asparagine-linked glycosylation protein 13 [Eremothecium gossypii ATCC 10895]AAS54448.1 AGL042Wp [Eremothecium gossypii ATCC 10895]AEY98780.1 FAGL042Wp [Eremothecium gossypii FDAG1]
MSTTTKSKMEGPKTVVVTCGATVPFPGLVNAVLDRRVLAELAQCGFSRVMVQYGRGFAAEFERQVGAAGAVRAACDAEGLEGCDAHAWRWQGLEIIGFAFHAQMESLIGTSAALVVSHAGTGSILDALRQQKPLIVCVNEALLDNHQEQIARRFEALGHLWAIRADVDELAGALARSTRETLAPLPPAYKQGFAELLQDVAHR